MRHAPRALRTFGRDQRLKDAVWARELARAEAYAAARRIRPELFR